MAQWRTHAWTVFRAGLVSIATASLMLPLLLGLNLLAARLDRGPVRAHVRQAFASGDLGLETGAVVDTRRGAAQFTDCLVMLMILDQRDTPWRRALSPAGEVRADENACLLLRRAVQDGGPFTAGPYHRYLHGPTALATFELAALPVDKLRLLLSRLGFLAVAGLIGVSAWRLAAALRRPAPDGRGDADMARPAFGLLAGAAFLLFWGLQFYGMSITHAPPDWLVVAYAWLFVLADFTRLPPWAAAVLHAAFGALAAYVEYFTGALPLGACLVLYAFAAAARRDDPAGSAARALAALTAFFGGAAVTLALKLALTMQAFGAQAVLRSFFDTLAFRTQGGHVTLWREGVALAGSGEYLGAGWPPLGVAVLVLTGAGFVASAARLAVRPSSRTPRAWLLLLSAGCIYGWWFVFRQQTHQHAFFAVRIGVGLAFSVPALVLCVFGRGLRETARRWLARTDAAAPPTAA